jgi:hypothetical protein
MQGQFDDARRLYELDRRILNDLAMPILREHSATIIGTVELLAGRPRVAELALRGAIAALERLGSPMNVSGLSAQLARALMDQGRDDEAWRVLESAQASPTSDVAHLVDVLGVRARLLVGKGAARQAHESAREAVSMADTTESADLQACSRIDMAHVLLDSGRGTDAKGVLAEALTLFEQKGNIVQAALARNLLAAS